MKKPVVTGPDDFWDRIEELELGLIENAMKHEPDKHQAMYNNVLRDSMIDLINDFREKDMMMMQMRIAAWSRAMSFYLAPQSEQSRAALISQILMGAELFKDSLGLVQQDIPTKAKDMN